MRRLIHLLFVFIFLLSPSLSFAANNQHPPAGKPTYVKATVTKIINEGEKTVSATQKNLYQNIMVKMQEGSEKNKEVRIEYGGTITLSPSQKVRTGETVILSVQKDQQGKTTYTVADKYRLPFVGIVLFVFFALVISITGRKGIGSILGLLISIGVIVLFIVPFILSGHDPLFISIVGSCIILLATIFLAHGFSQRTTVAAGATLISLALTALLAIIFVHLTRLSGLGSEDAYTLQQGFHNTINFQGLLLGGIIIGALGVLDDVTTTQSATVFTLAETDTKLKPMELFKRGMVVGREHIASVVNTLVLAYAGASIGVFIFLILATQNQAEPLWVILNSEVIVEEIVRSVAGSMGLVLAVPLTTIIAAFASRYSLTIK